MHDEAGGAVPGVAPAVLPRGAASRILQWAIAGAMVTLAD